MAQFFNFDINKRVSKTELTGSNNFERLKNNKIQTKLEKLFSNVPTDAPYSNPQMLKNKEGISDDLRLENEEDVFALSDGFDMLLSRRFTKNSRNLYKYYDSKQKRSELINLSQIDEIDDIVQKLASEVIVTDKENKRFAEIIVDEVKLKELNVKKSVINKITKTISQFTPNVYTMLRLYDTEGWKKFYRFAVEGSLAYEIVYDNVENPKRILGFNPLDSLRLRPYYDKGRRLWAYYEERMRDQRETKRVFYDSQVLRLDWKDVSPNGKTSYVEQLLKSYNMMRIVIEAKIIFAVNNATYRSLITIPVRGQSRKRATQTLGSEMMRYKDDVFFDSENGELKVNGSPNVPATKEIFLAEGDGGTPSYDTVSNNGPDLLNLEQDEFFTKRLYKASKIPVSRFDESLAETWSVDPSSTYRIEIAFSEYIDRIRNVFGKLLLTPMMNILNMEIPEIRGDFQIMDAISIQWVSKSIFKEFMEMDLNERRYNYIDQMRNTLTSYDENGDERPYFPIKYIVKEILHLTDEEIETIEKMRKEEEIEKIKSNADLEKLKNETRDKLGLNEEPNEEEF